MVGESHRHNVGQRSQARHKKAYSLLISLYESEEWT